MYLNICFSYLGPSAVTFIYFFYFFPDFCKEKQPNYQNHELIHKNVTKHQNKAVLNLKLYILEVFYNKKES